MKILKSLILLFVGFICGIILIVILSKSKSSVAEIDGATLLPTVTVKERDEFKPYPSHTSILIL